MTAPSPPSRRSLPARVERLSPVKRALYERLRGQAGGHTGGGPIPRRDPRRPAPLSSAQERLWFLSQLEPGNPFYNVAIAARIEGSLDRAALEGALQAVIDRHGALRTTFRAVDGRPIQIVAPRMAVRLPYDDLRSFDAAARDARLAQLTNEEALRPFDLERGPLVRARLVRIAEKQHALLLTLHHIICDGWSMAVLEEEVAECYAACVERRPPRLEPPRVTYADFAAWQRDQLRGPRLEEHVTYWLHELAALPPTLDLPTDRPRPAVQTFRGAVRRRRLGGAMARELRALAAEESATPAMVLLAAFQVLLARLSRERDICLGMPIANRGRQELERVVGLFANTLVIRGRLADNPTFREFLAQLRETMLGAYAHQDCPFEELVDRLRPERDLGRNPLVQVMFVLQNVPRRARRAAGFSIAQASFDHAPVASFDLTMNVSQEPDRFDLSLVYSLDLFEPATIDRWLDSYETLLAAIVRDRDACVLELPMIGALERIALVEGWNDTDAPFPQDRCVHELFAEQARRTPDAIAVALEDRAITYAALDRQSNQLARFLVERGAGPDVPIGLCLERSPAQIVALLAILKAGAAYLPLDPSYPRARRDFMIGDAGPLLVVTTRDLAAKLPATARHVLLDAERDVIAACDDGPLVQMARPRNLAYVIHTSGSTGEPKGIEVEHRGLVNHSLALGRLCGLGPADRLLQFLSLSFDAAAEEIFPALLSGTTLHLHPNPAELSGRVLLDWSRSHGVNVLHLPVTVWASLVDELSVSGGLAARHLKTVVAGGDNVAADYLRRWQEATGGAVKFLFAYGVTEATITSTIFDGSTIVPPTSSPCVPIGRPIANNRVYVLDEWRQPVPVGVPGELWIGGVGVARGYRGRPGLSAERFLPDPFRAGQDARIYRTGDLARWLTDGNLEFLGRVDRQVKIGGYRIEPGEIETALQLHDRVREAIVVAEGTGDARRLIAYVGCGPAAAPTESQLREFLAERLPGHMLPSAIVVMDQLPRLAGAKVDVASLPVPHRKRHAGAELVAPRNDAERTLADVWAAILGVERVGVHDNFFDLGGDSIRSIQVVARAGAAGIRITPKQLFQHQTICELARVADTRPAASAPQGPVNGPVALLPIQHEFFALPSDDRHWSNQSMLLEVASPASAEIIRAALHKLVTHHDALRLRYRQREDGTWLQTVVPPDEATLLERADFSATPSDEVARAIERVAAATQAGLDLEQGPIARFVYFDLGRDRPARLLIVIHHLAVDTVSWRILLEDMHSACLQLINGLPIELPPKTTPLCEWAQRLTALADTPEVGGELDFWASRGGDPTPLPRDHGGGRNLASSVDTVRVCLDHAATRSLLGEAQTTHRARPHEILLAALVRAIGDFTGGAAIHIDIEGHGREDLFDDVDLTRTVGWFTSLYPLVLRRPVGCCQAELLGAIKEQLRAVRRGGIGHGLLRWLSSEAAVRDRLAALPLPEICFNYLGQLDHTLPEDALVTWASESCGPLHSPRAARRHSWEIIAYVRDGQLRVEWHYSAESHRRATIERLAGALVEALRGLVEHGGPSAAVTPNDFPLSGVDEDDLAALSRLLAD